MCEINLPSVHALHDYLRTHGWTEPPERGLPGSEFKEWVKDDRNIVVPDTDNPRHVHHAVECLAFAGDRDIQDVFADIHQLSPEHHDRLALEAIMDDADVAYTRCRAALGRLLENQSLMNLAGDEDYGDHMERELRAAMRHLDGVRFAGEALHAKTPRGCTRR